MIFIQPNKILMNKIFIILAIVYAVSIYSYNKADETKLENNKLALEFKN